MVRLLVLLVVLVGLTGAPLTMPVAIAAPATPGGPDLKDTLEKGLKARRPNEFAFIAHVVHKVEQGKLPLELVNSTFLWARRQPDVPFPYFERGIRERAKRLGISL